jgi:hypothetical protein
MQKALRKIDARAAHRVEPLDTMLERSSLLEMQPGDDRADQRRQRQQTPDPGVRTRDQAEWPAYGHDGGRQIHWHNSACGGAAATKSPGPRALLVEGVERPDRKDKTGRVGSPQSIRHEILRRRRLPRRAAVFRSSNHCNPRSQPAHCPPHRIPHGCTAVAAQAQSMPLPRIGDSVHATPCVACGREATVLSGPVTLPARRLK